MSVLLPPKPGFRAGKPRLIDFGVLVRPPSGGPAQRINRLGNRFSIDVQPSTSRSDGAGRVLISRLMQGLTQGVLYAFPQDLDPGNVGTSVVVNGNGQSGSSIQLRGFPSGYTVLEGQFFSIVHNGRRYLHAAAADTQASQDSSGTMALLIVPMLRMSPSDGEQAEFLQPMIEGVLIGNALEWQLQTAPYLDAPFTIEEAA